MSRSLVSGDHPASRAKRGLDLYETPLVAVEALLRVEKIPQYVWEPACGPGAIVKTLREAGRVVRATDIIKYNCLHSQGGIDFLHQYKRTSEAIVTNPPFQLANEFVQHAIDLSPLVIMLLRLEFLAGDRGGLLDRHPPARVWIFRNRLPRMHQVGWTGSHTSARISLAWFVWDRLHVGPTELRRISWSKSG